MPYVTSSISGAWSLESRAPSTSLALGAMYRRWRAWALTDASCIDGISANVQFDRFCAQLSFSLPVMSHTVCLPIGERAAHALASAPNSRRASCTAGLTSTSTVLVASHALEGTLFPNSREREQDSQTSSNVRRRRRFRFADGSRCLRHPLARTSGPALREVCGARAPLTISLKSARPLGQLSILPHLHARHVCPGR
jgi:hypothetical protein